MAKSGDSKLQDAQTAQTANFRDPGGTTPEQLPDLLQGSAEEKKARGASPEEVARTEQSLEKLTRIIEGLNNRIRSLEGRPGSGVAVPETPLKKMLCGSCHQMMSVCHGKHITVHVWPKNEDYARFFEGVKINGVRYFGTCIVPQACVGDIASTVSAFEEGERKREQQRGRNRGAGQGARGISLSEALASMRDLVS